MKNAKHLLQEIAFLIKIFERAYILLLNNKFHFDEFQIERLNECKEISELLDEKKFDIFFMQLANEGFKEIIFNDLIGKINKYNNLVFEKKKITNDRFLNFYFENIPEFFKNQQLIKVKENDILEVEQSQSGIPQLEKQKVISAFEIELIHLKKEREQIYNKYSWIKINYYYKIFCNADEIIEKIESYFKISVLKTNNEIFDSELTEKIFDKMVEKKYIYPKYHLTCENFHLILNLKNPKQNCNRSLKVTRFGYLFKILSNNVARKGFNNIQWENFVIKEFDFNSDTLKSRLHENDETVEFDKIFNPSKVKNGQ